MKIEYAITLADFRSLQPVFARRPGANPGFKGVVGACCLVASLGVYCLIAGLGLPLAAFLVGLAAAAGFVGYFGDIRSVRRAAAKHEQNILAAFQRLHCRDRRTLEVSPTTFTMTCNCGAVTRPWSELVQFSENDKFLQLRTKADGMIVPKSAFASTGDITEFRRLATEQINQTRAFAARPIEFNFTRADRSSARLLHIVRGGGWRLLARAVAILFGLAVIINYFLRLQGGAADPLIPLKAFGLVFGAFLVALLARTFRNKPAGQGPLRAYFGEAGLHLEDRVTIARHGWDNFCGYLENGRIFLLYHHPRLYRIIPKRALAERESEFAGLVRKKLSPFNYRNPAPVANPEPAKPA